MKNFTRQPILVLVLLCCLSQMALSQSNRRNTNQRPTSQIPIDSATWRQEHYVVNRDSAYADPRIGLRKLMGGNRRFIENKSIRPRQDLMAVKATENGQAPFAIIVGCADSRVPNELIFDQGFGDLFIIRTAGQVSAAASYGSMEFAVLKLQTKLIVVLGHTECGAVAAAVERPVNPPGHIVTLINEIKPAVAKSAYFAGDKLQNAVRQNVIEQVKNLRDLEPVLSGMYQNGEILIVGAVYDIHTGKVEFLQETLENMPIQKSNTSAKKQAATK
jgi:carbonic anhydrase